MTGRPAVPIVSRVAFLLSIQGAGQIATSLLELLLTPMTFFYAALGHHPLPSNLEASLLFGWLLLVGVAGVISLRAARLNREYRGRTVGLVALALGPISCLFGIPIMLYGVWCYRRPDVRAVFEMGESGASPWQIEHS